MGSKLTEKQKKQIEAREKSKNGNGNGKSRVRVRATRSGLVDRIMSGEEDLSKWTIDDLINGFPAGRRSATTKEGRKRQRKQGIVHRGRPPTMVPRQVHEELAKRMMMWARHQFFAELQFAIEEHMMILKSPIEEVGARTKLEAIKMIYDRVLGAPEQHVNIHDEDLPYKSMMAAAIVNSQAEVDKKEKAKALPVKGVKRADDD